MTSTPPSNGLQSAGLSDPNRPASGSTSPNTNGPGGRIQRQSTWDREDIAEQLARGQGVATAPAAATNSSSNGGGESPPRNLSRRGSSTSLNSVGSEPRAFTGNAPSNISARKSSMSSGHIPFAPWSTGSGIPGGGAGAGGSGSGIAAPMATSGANVLMGMQGAESPNASPLSPSRVAMHVQKSEREVEQKAAFIDKMFDQFWASPQMVTRVVAPVVFGLVIPVIPIVLPFAAGVGKTTATTSRPSNTSTQVSVSQTGPLNETDNSTIVLIVISALLSVLWIVATVIFLLCDAGSPTFTRTASVSLILTTCLLAAQHPFAHLLLSGDKLSEMLVAPALAQVSALVLHGIVAATANERSAHCADCDDGCAAGCSPSSPPTLSPLFSCVHAPLVYAAFVCLAVLSQVGTGELVFALVLPIPLLFLVVGAFRAWMRARRDASIARHVMVALSGFDTTTAHNVLAAAQGNGEAVQLLLTGGTRRASSGGAYATGKNDGGGGGARSKGASPASPSLFPGSPTLGAAAAVFDEDTVHGLCAPTPGMALVLSRFVGALDRVRPHIPDWAIQGSFLVNSKQNSGEEESSLKVTQSEAEESEGSLNMSDLSGSQDNIMAKSSGSTLLSDRSITSAVFEPGKHNVQGGGSTGEHDVSVVMLHFSVVDDAPTPDYSEHRFLERVFSVAKHLHGVVHHFVGSTCVVTWNAVRRTAAPESKAARFLQTMSSFSGDQYVRVSGAAMTGKVRCHLAGSRHKSLVLSCTWWPVLEHVAAIARSRNSMMIDTTTKAAVFYEYCLRGYGALELGLPGSVDTVQGHAIQSSFGATPGSAATDTDTGGEHQHSVSPNSSGGDNGAPVSPVIGERRRSSVSHIRAELMHQRDRAAYEMGQHILQTFEIVGDRHEDNVEWLALFQRERDGEADHDHGAIDGDALSCVALELAVTKEYAAAKKVLRKVLEAPAKRAAGIQPETLLACKAMLERLESNVVFPIQVNW